MSSRRELTSSAFVSSGSRLAIISLVIVGLALFGFSIGAAISHSANDQEVASSNPANTSTQQGLVAVSDNATFPTTARNSGSKSATTTMAHPVEDAEPRKSTTNFAPSSETERPSEIAPRTSQPAAPLRTFVPAPRLATPAPVPPATAPAPQLAPAPTRAEPKIDFLPLPPPAYELDGGAVRFN